MKRAAALGGDRNIKISSRVGYNAVKCNKIALNMELVIDFLFKVALAQNIQSNKKLTYNSRNIYVLRVVDERRFKKLGVINNDDAHRAKPSKSAD